MAVDNSANRYLRHYSYGKPTKTYRYPDLENMPQPLEESPEIRRASNITMKKTPPRRGTASKVFLFAFSAFSISFFFISNKVETNKIYNQKTSATQRLESVQSENVRLKSELESKMTLKNVEDYAVNVLGLQKLNNSQIEYVETQTDDVVEIPQGEKNIFVKIKDKCDDILEYIFG